MGTWYVSIKHNIYDRTAKMSTVMITTQSGSQCSNFCSLKGSAYQLVPGTKTNECMCNPLSGATFNPITKTCDCDTCSNPVAAACGNSII